MKPIDLTQFAEHSQKIPADFLRTPLYSEIPFRKREVLATHFLDSVVIAQVFVWFRAILEVSIGNLMIGDLASDAYATTGGMVLNLILLTVISAAYFTSSYFFNQGQTAGMKMMKRRISMDGLSFEPAFKWTIYSLSIYFTFGMSISTVHKKLQESGQGSFSGHDHLYAELMSYKTWGAPALIEVADGNVSEEKVFDQAA